MTNLYRVIPLVSNAKKGEPGHPLFFPQNQGLARIDNSGYYSVGYMAASGDCAVAETFGYLNSWDSQMLRPIKTLPKSHWAVITYELGGGSEIFEMDDANNLQKLMVRPSRVVTRNRAVTQAWALKVFKGGQSVGVSWWSYYNPDWSCVGLWNLSKLKTAHVETLRLDHLWVDEASRATNRPIIN